MNYLTYKDIAEMTGLTEGALRLLKFRGKLPAPDVTTDYAPTRQIPMWRRQTIEKWIRERDNEPASTT